MSDAEKLQRMAQQYREFAREAREASTVQIPSKWKLAYEVMARHWTEIADELEAVMGMSDRRRLN